MSSRPDHRRPGSGPAQHGMGHRRAPRPNQGPWMTFLYAAALAVVALVVAPLIPHLLGRRRTDERAFPPARLVPPSPPIARRRRRVDDRLLYAVRTLSVALLAVLGASPFVHCSSLALGRAMSSERRG